MPSSSPAGQGGAGDFEESASRAAGSTARASPAEPRARTAAAASVRSGNRDRAMGGLLASLPDDGPPSYVAAKVCSRWVPLESPAGREQLCGQPRAASFSGTLPTHVCGRDAHSRCAPGHLWARRAGHDRQAGIRRDGRGRPARGGSRPAGAGQGNDASHRFSLRVRPCRSRGISQRAETRAGEARLDRRPQHRVPRRSDDRRKERSPADLGRRARRPASRSHSRPERSGHSRAHAGDEIDTDRDGRRGKPPRGRNHRRLQQAGRKRHRGELPRRRIHRQAAAVPEGGGAPPAKRRPVLQSVQCSRCTDGREIQVGRREPWECRCRTSRFRARATSKPHSRPSVARTRNRYCFPRKRWSAPTAARSRTLRRLMGCRWQSRAAAAFCRQAA